MADHLPAPHLPAARPVALRRLALLLAILISGGSLLFPREPMLLMVIALCLLVTGLRLPSARLFWPLFVLLAAVLIGTLVRPGPVGLGSLASRFTYYCSALLLLNMYMRAPAGSLVRDLQVLLMPMAFQALATVALAHTVGFLFMPLEIASMHYQTLGLLFTYHITIEGLGGLIRPDGFFFEPGVYQIYLNLYLFLAAFVFRSRWQVALAALAVLSTQSTTGILICVLILGSALARRLGSGHLRARMAAIALAVVLAPPILMLGYDNITDKLFGSAQGSSWAREYDLFTGLNIVVEHPWLGIGFEVDRYLEASGRLGFEDTQLTSRQLEERPTSNGLVQLFYSLGIPLALPFLWGLFRQKLFRQPVLIGLSLTMSLFGEALLFTPFFLFIVFSAFVVLPPPRARIARSTPAHAQTPDRGELAP